MKVTLGLGVGALAAMLFLGFSGVIGSEFLPHLDEGAIWVRGTLAPSTGPSSSITMANQVRRVLADFSEVRQVVSQVGRPDDGSDASGFYNTEFFVDLLPRSKWRSEYRTKDELIAAMYVALITSRTVEDAMIQRFNLQQEYREKKLSDTRKALERRTMVTAGSKDGLIRLSIEDRNPQRAAELANGYLEEFRKLSATLAITEAARRRLFFEEQLKQTKESLTAAENAMTSTQRSTGVLQIDSQARALIESAAVLRAQVAAKQVQIQGMRSYAAEDNPDLILAKQELAALQAQLQRIAGSQNDPGSDINLSKGRVTDAGMEYLRRYRELKYQETVFELLSKEFEIAKLDEAREGSIVQVVDTAIPPDKKSSPHRFWIVLGSTFAAFVVAVFWVNLRRRFDLASELPQNRHRLRLIKGLWKSTPPKTI